ncbi:hypothetical protein [uncultured Mucilaginibacter sp.]|uniref:hypothetical protein n=1 Tax=uncultured Mucilaginibacter sp. TaxID=797541 RepID=UPI0025FFAD8E|nr:hypothetical protein [uncultured Mucilaginibacter sp.]
MPEVVITYKKPETLKILKSLAKYLDFKMSETKSKPASANGVTIIPGDKNLDISALQEVFTGAGIDAAKLRKEAWQRKS